MQKESWQKSFNDLIGGLVNLSVVAIVLFFTSTQALKFFSCKTIFQFLFLGFGTLCLLVLFIIGVLAFVDEKATPLLNRSKNKFFTGILMIAIGFFLLMPTFYTLFLSTLLK